MPELLTPAEVAATLRVSLRKAYLLLADGTLPVVRIGAQPRCPADELEKWIRTRVSLQEAP